SWMKLRNGSLRDLVPDHYRLGYMLVMQGRQRYGDSIWKAITADAAAFRGLFYPFQRAFRRHTGQSFRQFRQESLRAFQQQARIRQLFPLTGPKTDALGPSAPDTAAATGRRFRHFSGDERFPQWAD